jgi:hypothetical protein
VALDAGALLFPEPQFIYGVEEQLKATAMGVVASYNVMNFAAVGIAPQDLAAGLDFLKNMQEKSTFPWLSSNLVDPQSRKPLFPGSTTIKAGNLVLAVIGLTGETVPPEILGDDFSILPWQKILPEMIDKLTDQVDMIVLLSSYPLSENQKIAEMFPGIHVIIQAGSLTTNLQPQSAGNALITQTERKGKHIGLLEISWQKSKEWGTNPQQAITELKNEEDRIRWQLNRYRKKGEPEVVYRDNQKILEAYKGLLQKHENILAEIAAIEKKTQENRTAGITPSSFTAGFIAMETSLPDDKTVQEIVTATNETVNEIGKKNFKGKTQAGKPAEIFASSLEDYRGWQTCGSCHPRETEAWQETRHARAYRTLEDKGQQFNFKCIPCHVTGISLENSQNSSSLPPDLRAVGCESCHGPGREHLDNPEKKIPVAPAEAICLGCHQPDQDDDFDYGRDKRLVH